MRRRRTVLLKRPTALVFGWVLLLLAPASAAAQPTPTYGYLDEVITPRVPPANAYNNDVIVIYFSAVLRNRLGHGGGLPPNTGISDDAWTIKLTKSDGTVTTLTDTNIHYTTVTSNYAAIYLYTSAFLADDIVTVSYEAPTTGNKLESGASPHTAVADFDDFRVHNIINYKASSLDSTDKTPPSISSVTLNTAGDQVDVLFNEAMDTQNATVASLFTLGGTNAVVTGTPNFGGGNTKLSLKLAPTVASGDTPKLSYAPATTDVTYLGIRAPAEFAKLLDRNGNAMPSFTRPALRSGGSDTTAPSVLSAVVDGSVLTLTFDEDLDRTATPAASRFTLAGTSNSASVSSVAFKSSDLTALELTLDKAALGTTITLSYAKGTDANPLKDTAATANEVADFTGQAVTIAADTTAPVYPFSWVDGSTLTFRFNEELDTTAAPGTARFTLTFAGGSTTTGTVTAVAFKSGDANAVELTVSPAVTASETASRIELQYAKGTEANPLKDQAGNEVPDSIPQTSHWVVANWTGRPQPETATVDGTKLTLTFTEDLDTTGTPAVAAFTVSGTDATTAVSAVAFKSGDAKSLELTLSPAVEEGDTGITVEYDDDDAGANPLKNTAATAVQVGYFNTWPVRNLTDATAPTIQAGTVNGTLLTLTFDEDLDTTAAPAASRFLISGPTSATTVTAVAFKAGDAKSVELTLSPAVTSGVNVRVSYLQGDDANPLKDKAPTPNKVADFSGFLVTNNSPPAPPPPPDTPGTTTVGAVSNTGQTAASGSATAGGSGQLDVAQTFTTGGNSAGYTLSAVDLKLASGTPSANTTVKIYTTTGNPPVPNSAEYTLAKPSSLVANATNTFTTTGIPLLANTTYAVVISVGDPPAGTALALTNSDDEDSGAASGWSIGNTRHEKGTSPSWASGSESLMIAIKATATFVSNTGQGLGATHGFGTFSGVNWLQAQTFTTGGNAAGYTLSAVEMRTATGVNSGNAKVSIYTTTGSPPAPDSSLHVLNTPSSLPANTIITFTADAGASLDANTTYAVVFENSGGDTSFRTTSSDAEDTGKASGWSIGNNRHLRQSTASSWSNGADGQTMVIAIKGTAKPDTTAPTVVSATVEGTVLTLGFSEDLDTTAAPAASRFTVSGTASATTVTAVAFRSGDARSVELTLSRAVTASETGVTVAYAKGSDANPLKDKASPANEVADFAGQAVLTVVTLVGNTGQTVASGSFIVGTSAGVNWSHAQTFTTGGNTAGYTLSAVDVRLASGTPSANTRVSIYTTLSGSPNAGVHVLNNPSSLTASATNTFTAVAGATLAASTTYAVVFEVTSGAATTGLSKTASDNEAGETGWSIGDKAHTRSGTNAWAERTDSDIPMIAIKGAAKTLVMTPPPDTTPQDPSGADSQPAREPVPLQLALWTDRPAYGAGESVRLYRTLDPHDDDGRYRTFVYLERAGGEEGEEGEEAEERSYLSPLSAAAELHADPVNDRGMPEDLAKAWLLTPADRELIFEGPVPEPGLWQFVLELRPEADKEQDKEQDQEPDPPLGTRRAWTKFAVAERMGLFNHRGRDLELTADLTLRSDTIYHLLRQVFVNDGVTLTVEPGTVVLGWGRNAAIIVEPGGRIVAEGTRESPVVLTCSAPVGQRRPGCWGGLRILGKAPVTRLEGVAPGVLPPERPVYGGTAGEDSSGVLRYVRVEFAGAGDNPDTAPAAIGLYGAGNGTVLDHVEAHGSLGDGFGFHGGTAVCQHCVASGSGRAGLSWKRGWRGGASHLYVQHGSGGLHGIEGGNDERGHDLEPRSLPALSKVTLVHAAPYGEREREGVGLRLSTGSGVTLRGLLVTRFWSGAIEAGSRSGLLFTNGESSVNGTLLYRNGYPQVLGRLRDAVEFVSEDPQLRDVRDFPNPDPRPKPSLAVMPGEGECCIGAFDTKENWLEEWTVFGPESVYDLREGDDEEN